MRGESHLTISMLMVLPAWYAIYMFNPSPLWQSGYALVLVGIATGSLFPDVDASDAKIMHGTWKPVGFFGKYVFYKPLTRVLGKRSDLFRDEHRGFLHSLLGCLLASVFFAACSLIIGIFQSAWSVWWFWLGIPIGFLLHLAEDSFTKGGVRWFFPHGEPTLSTTQTFRGSEYLLVMAFQIGAVILLTVVWLLPSSIMLILITCGVTLILFGFFHRINPRISKLGDKLLLPYLVERHVLKRGGIKVDIRNPGISAVSIDGDGKRPQFYIARIANVGGPHGLGRDFIIYDSGFIEAKTMKEKDIVEVRTYQYEGELRRYYVVRNSSFYLFAEHLI
ncbi:MAG: metal-dependent hydrolase [Candidatus Thorarchaeota archaeon]